MGRILWVALTALWIWFILTSLAWISTHMTEGILAMRVLGWR